MPGPASEVHDSLATTLTSSDLHSPPDTAVQLENYCAHLWDWNRKLNLTRHTDYEKFVTRDLIDSLQLAELLKPGEAVLDVGSGGGVPGSCARHPAAGTADFVERIRGQESGGARFDCGVVEAADTHPTTPARSTCWWTCASMP